MEVWNKKVNPEDYPDFYCRKVSPITREDLGNRFHTSALRQFHIDKNGYMDRYKEEIKLFTETYDFGDVLWLHYRFTFAKNFKEVVQYIKEKGLYIFDIWGYVPTRPLAGFSEYKAAITPNGNAHQYLLQVLGSKFLGWDNGEQDGRFFGVYAPRFCPSPQNRKDAYEGFSRYFHHLCDDLENYMTVLLGMYSAHYMAHFGNHRLLGAETAQGLPSVPPWYAFIRGAGKQYGILWFGNASVFNRWGYKKYGKQNKKDPRLARGGPNKGTSLALLKRLWYVEYMYGSCMMGYEQGHIFELNSEEYLAALDGRTKALNKFPKNPSLTPIGQLQVDCTKWCKKHPNIGAQYTPVALLMDFYTGWAPPRSYYHYAQGNYFVWGNMYYEKGDHQIDTFFRLVYPGYEDSSFYKDERGFLTSTPAGDIFDVLFSNVSNEILHRYNLVILLGEIRLEGKLLDKIKKFLKGGGKVIVSSVQLSGEGREEFNLKTTGTIKESKVSKMNGKVFKEKLFQYEIIDIPQAEVLATSEQDGSLILKKKYGKGDLIITTVDFALNKEESKKPLPSARDSEVPLPPKYYLLECVKTFLLDYLKQLNLLEVQGSPIQYITNVTDDPRKIYVTLSNNENKLWEGKIRVKREKSIEIEDLFNHQKLVSSKGEFKTRVKPLDVGIYAIKSNEPIVTFKKPFKAREERNRLAIWSRADARGSIWQNIETIGRSSFNSIEICATQVSGMNDTELSLLSEELRAGNLNVSALSLVHAQTPYVDNNNLASPLPWTLEENRKFLSRSLEIVEALECKRIILSTGKLAEGGQSLEEAFRVTADNISEFGRKAKESGINILVEPAPYRVFGKAEELIKLVNKINLANVGIALDTGHSFWFDENPITSLKKLGGSVKYINLNSPAYFPGSGLIDKHLIPGEGLFDEKGLDTFLKELKKINYQGILCFNGYFSELLIQNLQKEFNKSQKYFKITD